MENNNFKSLEEIPEHFIKNLEQFVSDVFADTFVISGLPPELTGGVMARYSRAKTGLVLTLANEFCDEDGNPSAEKGAAIMDRVLNAFGDESVGELEGAHMGLEEVSNLLTKTVEDLRIGGSPIEQSSRYVKYDMKDKDGNWRYLRPKEIMESGLGEKYVKVMDKCFEVYVQNVSKLIKYFRKELPKEQFKIDVERDDEKVSVGLDELVGTEEENAFREAYRFTIRCAALDVGRCVLPAATRTHFGVYGNGRFWTHAISKLKSSELAEERERGKEIEEELNKAIPTFIKRNRIVTHRQEVDAEMKLLAEDLLGDIEPHANGVTLLERADTFDEVIAYALFPYARVGLDQITERVQEWSYEKKLEIMDKYIGNRENRFDRSGRGLEAGYPIMYDLVGGFGEYRDLERHRQLTQQRQRLTTELGFIMLPEIFAVGQDKAVEEVVEMVEELNKELRDIGLDAAAQYATLFNHKVRWAMGMNYRQPQHMNELRTQLAGHFLYRSKIMEMARQLNARDPWAAKIYGFINYSDPDNKITRAKEQGRIAGKNLVSGIDGSLDL